MLLAAGIPLPTCVFGHGFIHHSGTKMSKSLGNIVNPLDVVERTGADSLRYFLLREITFGKDGDFTWDGFITRANADLANDLGNLLKRTTDMTLKFLEGRIAAGIDAGSDRTGLRTAAETAARDAVAAYAELDPSGALDAVWALVRRANQAVQETKPWEVAKDPARRDELSGTLSEILEAIRIVGELAEPAIPRKAARLRERLGLDAAIAEWSDACVWRDRPAWIVRPGEPLVPRLERGEPAAKSSSAPAAPASPAPAAGGAIGIDRFREVQLVVATILAASRVEGADRLLRLELDLGHETRQVVAGIAQSIRADDLPGTQVVVVANLEPTTIRGVESRGMVLVAKTDGTLTLLGPRAPVAPGAPIS
jgi:methionyl-tRNA synthetase